MAVFNKDKERNVIPNFRNLVTTASMGELNSIKKIHRSYSLSLSDLEDIVSDWKKEKTLPIALNLLNCANVAGIYTNEDVIAASKFIICNDKSTLIQKDLAYKFLPDTENNNLEINNVGLSNRLLGLKKKHMITYIC